MEKIDHLDKKIIAALQTNAALSVATIGEAVGLSQNACWRRIRHLEDAGLLKAKIALFDNEKLGYPITVFAILKVREHDRGSFENFAQKIIRMPEVLEFYRMSGEIDYMAKIVARDVKHYDDIYKRIISTQCILSISSSFSMEEIKCTTALPVD